MVHLISDLSMYECHCGMWCVLPPTWILPLLRDSKIRFDFKSNLTSEISKFSELRHLASYVSHHNAMAYDSTSAHQGNGRDHVYTLIETLWRLVVACPSRGTSHLNVCSTPTFLRYSQFKVDHSGTTPTPSWNYFLAIPDRPCSACGRSWP